MLSDTGNLSLYLGFFFIGISLLGIIIIYFLMKNNSIEKDRIDKLIELGKWFIASVAIVLSTAIVNDGFREREQDIKEIDVFDKYVTTITKADGIEQRWLLVEYFATVSPQGRLQESWKRYQEILKPGYLEYKENKERIAEIAVKENPTEVDRKELILLQDKNESLNKSLIATSVQTEWVVIAGTDISLEAAQYEMRKVKKLDLPVSIYKKGDKFITVVGPFANYDAALKIVPEIKKTVNSTAYQVRLNNFCPNAEMQKGYLLCR